MEFESVKNFKQAGAGSVELLHTLAPVRTHCNPLTMTRLTRETALALIPSIAIDPSMCTMILATIPNIMAAAQMLKPISKKETTNTATER